MNINIQPAEKRVANHDGLSLDVHSIFYTIQGEGPYAGRPAVFIRLAGCNLKCPGCDTDYTSNRSKMTLLGILCHVEQSHKDAKLQHISRKPLVVITGGEPFRQNISPVTQKLIRDGYAVQVETNGTMPPSPHFPVTATVVCSPKSHKLNDKMLYRADHFKYVLHSDSVHPTDGLPLQALGNTANPYVARPPIAFNGNIYLQPMDTQDEYQNICNRMAVVRSCMQYGYIVQLQIHKLLGVD